MKNKSGTEQIHTEIDDSGNARARRLATAWQNSFGG